MYGKLSIDDMNKIQAADISTLQEIAKNAYIILVPKQKLYCDEYLICKKEKQAAINAGYIEYSVDKSLVRLRRNINVCLYISAIQELKNRENRAFIEAESKNVDADNDMSKEACRRIINDPEASNADVLNAVDKLAKLNGVYKEKPETGKNKAFSIKKPENMSNNEQKRDKQSTTRKISIDSTKPSYGDKDSE